MLNDAVVVEAAQALGRRAVARAGALPGKIAWLFESCLGRQPDRAELRLLEGYWENQHQRFASGTVDPSALAGEGGPGEAAERAAWTALARVLFNLDEFITRG
jgi:hypothetical protein